MKNLKKLSLILMMLHGIATVGLASSLSLIEAPPEEVRETLTYAIKQKNGLQEGFRLINENFDQFVDHSITTIIYDKDHADKEFPQLMEILNTIITDKIIRTITPLIVNQLKTAIENKEDLKMDDPTEFATKNPVLKYVLDYTDSFTGQIFRDRKEPSGRITKALMNPSQRYRSDTILIKAVKKQNISIIKFLLAAGVDATEQGPQSQTALTTALIGDNSEVVQILIDNRIDVNARTESGNTPLHLTTITNAHKTAHILINAGADVNAINNEGNTPLHDATYWHTHEIARILINHGARNTRNNKGRTPLDYSISEEIRNLLLAKQQEL